jgi:methionyl-tRNA formyltransferase
MINQMDAGPVYTKVPLSLQGSAQDIYFKVSELSVGIIEWIIEHEPEPIPQEGEVVLFKRRKPDQSALPEVGSLSKAYDFIRMLDAEGYPHAFINHGEYVLIFRKAKLENGRLMAEVEIKSKYLD